MALTALVAGTAFGLRTIVPALRVAGFDVVGLVGSDPERTARRAGKAGIAAAFTDFDAALAATKPDAVAIATPPHTHRALVLSALAAGVHVICEKPFAADTAEAAEMVAAAEGSGLANLIGHEFRWAPDRALVRRVIAEGRIGTPRMLALHQFFPMLADPAAAMPPWWFDAGQGGGWLGAHGSHMIDQTRSWLGEFASLSAKLPTVADRPDAAEDSYIVRATLASGAEVVQQQSAAVWGSGSDMTLVAGTEGAVSIEGGKVFLADRSGKAALAVPDDLALPDLPELADDPGIYLIRPYARLATALRELIETGATTSPVPLPTFRDGLQAMKVMDAIRASAAGGGSLVDVA